MVNSAQIAAEANALQADGLSKADAEEAAIAQALLDDSLAEGGESELIKGDSFDS